MADEMIEGNSIAKFTAHNMDLLSFAPLNLKLCSGEIVMQRCKDYFALCTKNEIRPSIAGFALSLGTSRETLLKYIKGEVAIPDDVKQVLDTYYSALNALMEDFAQSGKINPIPAIFLLKNNFGYKDQQDFVVNNKQEKAISEETLLEEANLLTDTKPKLANLDD